MLLRLQVSGFKNLVDVDVRFGPFTCIAGGNGVGKSNLLDAIQFLSQLSEKPIQEALATVRGDSAALFIPSSFFYQDGSAHLPKEMKFVADILLPQTGEDELGNTIQARVTLLRYSLHLQLKRPQHIEIVSESLQSLTPGESKELFSEFWMLPNSTVSQPLDTITLISTDENGTMSLFPDDPRNNERTGQREKTQRTLLTQAEPSMFPTAYLAQTEFRSWRIYHLEPTALRAPDHMSHERASIAANGAHMAATLYALANESQHPDDLYKDIAVRLRQLIGDVRSVGIDSDAKRNMLELYLEDRQGVRHTARALSDGTLRILAMTILEHDPRPGIACIEEPENGLHPERITIMLELLQAIACDPHYPINETNPLRQVIITTHSPIVVSHVPEGSLLYADHIQRRRNKKLVPQAIFRWLKNTWRARIDTDPKMTVARGAIFSYVSPPLNGEADPEDPQLRTVIHNPDIQTMLQRDLSFKQESNDHE